MQIVDVRRDLHTLGIDPWTLADAITRVDSRRAANRLHAQIGAPGLAAGARLRRQGLAMPVGAFDATEVGAVGTAGAGDEEGHVGKLRWLLLRPQFAAQRERCNRRHGNGRHPDLDLHVTPCGVSMSLGFFDAKGPRVCSVVPRGPAGLCHPLTTS